MPLLNLAAIGLYLIATGAAIVAAGVAFRAKRHHHERTIWTICATFFVGLAFIRHFQWEEVFRQAIRTYFRSHGIYEGRWETQAPLFILALILGLAILYFCWRYWPPRGVSRGVLYVHLASIAMLGFVPLFAMRIISLHAMDRILYANPIRPNWVLDGGLTGLAITAAVLYILRYSKAIGSDSR